MSVRPYLLAAAVLIWSLAGGSFAARARAQLAISAPYCSGSYNIVRVSEIKPGMMAKFVQAVAAQKAWYKAAGAADEITLMRVIDYTGGFSDKQALTGHTTPAGAARIPHDPKYDYFVSLYKESSTVKQEFFTCIGKP